MSSTTDARDVLGEAIAHVTEESFFAVADPAEPRWRDASSDSSEWLEASVAFHGAGEGQLTCRLPRALAGDLSAAFLGLDRSEVDDEAAFDMAGELANMVCGCWLTRAFPSELFTLDHPLVRVGPLPPADDWVVLIVNGEPLGVLVTGRGV